MQADRWKRTAIPPMPLTRRDWLKAMLGAGGGLALAKPKLADGAQTLITFNPPTILSRSVLGVPDQVSVANPPLQPHPTPQPLFVLSSPSGAGSAAFRSWAEWYVEPLNCGLSHLYMGVPVFSRRADGSVYGRVRSDNISVTLDAYLREQVKHFADWDGRRNDNWVNPYVTFVPHRSRPLWYGIDMVGRLFKVGPTGTVETLAGRVASRRFIPYLDEGALTPQEHLDRNTSVVGNFEDGALFNSPIDLAISPLNPHHIYVADTYNHRICLVDLRTGPATVTTFAGAYRVASDAVGPRLTARFDEPYSIDFAPDGTLYVADEENSKIKRIDPARIVSVVVAAPVIDRPQVLRLASNGNLVVGEHHGGLVYELNVVTGARRNIHRLPSDDGRWIWLDVDTYGHCGPVDDIFVVASGTATAHLERVSFDGRFVSDVPGSYGPLPHGPAQLVADPAGHYAWAVAVSDTEARFVTTGIGSAGIRQWRRLHASDPRVDTDRFSAESRIYLNGTSNPGFEGQRPSFELLYGPSGWSLLGIPNADDMSTWTDEQIADYLRSGADGQVPRTELTGQGLAAVIYFIRSCAARLDAPSKGR